MLDGHGLTPAQLAQLDQAIAAVSDEVTAMADRAVVEGVECCNHPLCPGETVLTELFTTLTMGPVGLLAVASASIRLLGDARRGAAR